MKEIVQIVPRLPPSISGVGDYAFLLAGELRRAHGVQTTFVLGEPTPENAEARKKEFELDGFKVARINERRAEELLQVLSRPEMPGTVVLQYVGYGYEKRGCPVWLVNALCEWKCGAANESRMLAIMFHELYARRGEVWTSSFWNSTAQRRLAAQLTEISCICWTNRNRLRAEIEQMAPRHGGRVRVLPVFSNFGEPENPSPLEKRKSQAVFFGGFGRGQKENPVSQKLLDEALEHFGIERLVVAGARNCGPLRLHIPVENHGAVSAAKAEELLNESRAGVLDYFDGELAKSGIFAAYCAHGLIPLLVNPNNSESDGLKAGADFLVAAELKSSVSLPEQQRVATRAREWYLRHALRQTATFLAEDITAFQTTMAVATI